MLLIRRSCLWVMGICLAVQGFILLFSGWWLPEVPFSVHLTGIIWLASAIAMVFIEKYPAIPVALGITMFVLQTVLLQRSAMEKADSVGFFLYQHSTELLYLIAAIVLFVISRTASKHYRGVY
jgi:hypothetical protein